jgi:hypothetical protein
MGWCVERMAERGKTVGRALEACVLVVLVC